MLMIQSYHEYLMFANLRAWCILLKLLISLSNELGMVYTLTLFFLKGFSMVYTRKNYKKAPSTTSHLLFSLLKYQKL
jgi:hypothetical protein